MPSEVWEKARLNRLRWELDNILGGGGGGGGGSKGVRANNPKSQNEICDPDTGVERKKMHEGRYI